jgi:predicted amidohydrolase YtcJ
MKRGIFTMAPGFPLQSLTQFFIKFLFTFLTLFLFSCAPKQEWVDLIVYNANIYTVDSIFSIKQSMAIKGGKIVAVGTDEEIKTKYNSSTLLDAGQKTIFPGFIDAHCHFLGYGLGLQHADLTGTKSFEEVLKRLPSPTEESLRNGSWIVGRGWDQNDWDIKEYPTNEKLNSLYPNTPVFLKRIDGHAALVNETALRLAGINEKTKISGGEFILKDGKLTGVLIDNAVDLVSKVIPPPSKEQIQKALLAAQKNCFAVGLTTVDDAGLLKKEIEIIDELQKKGDLKMRMYVMLSDDTLNYTHYLKTGPYKTDKLNVRSFKFYADGALGSRGACLLLEYSDKKSWKGFLLSEKKHFETYAKILAEKGFQMNTHCIGDSSDRIIAYIYAKNQKPDSRWRIEHAQVVNKNDFDLFKNITPSVQPTHATSDMYWAEERLGKERVKYAYAYKDLLKAAGMVALGTDFPVEDISPFKTFYAAVVRKDSKGFPENGFQIENALSREETIKGMTIWAAYSNFEEKEKGSLEPGKFADFIMLDTDLMKCKPEDILKTKVLSAYLGGRLVFEKK